MGKHLYFISAVSYLFVCLSGCAKEADNSTTPPLSQPATDWTAANTGLTNPYVNKLAVDGSRIYAAVGADRINTSGRVFVSTNDGVSWTESNFGINQTTVTSIVANGPNVFIGTWGSGFYRSTDYGATWAPANAGLTSSFIASVAVVGTTLFAGASTALFRSTNNASSWSLSNGNLPNSGLPGDYVYSYALSDSNLFVASHADVYRSTNDGISWQPVIPGGPLGGTYELCWIPNPAGGIFLFAGTTIDDALGFPRGSVYVYTNNAPFWAHAQEGLPPPPARVYALIVHSGSLGQPTLLAGSLSSVYRSTNLGSIWFPDSSGLSNLNSYVTTLAIKDSTLFAGFSGRGVWRRSLK